MHHSGVRSGGWWQLLFGLADFCVTLGELQPNGLRHVGIKPHSLLQVEAKSIITANTKIIKRYNTTNR